MKEDTEVVSALKCVKAAITKSTFDNIEDEISEREEISYWGVIDLIDKAIAEAREHDNYWRNLYLSYIKDNS